MKLVLVGATEGWIVAREIAAAKVPVLVSPLTDLPSSFEQLGATQSNAGRLKTAGVDVTVGVRSEGHTSELQSLMRISYAVFCLTKKQIQKVDQVESQIQ